MSRYGLYDVRRWIPEGRFCSNLSMDMQDCPFEGYEPTVRRRYCTLCDGHVLRSTQYSTMKHFCCPKPWIQRPSVHYHDEVADPRD